LTQLSQGKLKKPSGTGFQPVQALKYTKRNLPHWQIPGSVYFITWRCLTGNILSPEERSVTLNAIRHWHGIKWVLYATVVMPDHVHALAQPLNQPTEGTFGLTEILHSIKRFSARKVNQARGVQGSLWQDERFDRIVRDEGEFLEKWNYIRNNPVKAGLTIIPEEYPWLYENDG
jgi:REP element-mobilizing transposase RayT